MEFTPEMYRGTMRGIGSMSEAPPDAEVPFRPLKTIFDDLQQDAARDPAFRFWKVELENP